MTGEVRLHLRGPGRASWPAAGARVGLYDYDLATYEARRHLPPRGRRRLRAALGPRRPDLGRAPGRRPSRPGRVRRRDASDALARPLRRRAVRRAAAPSPSACPFDRRLAADDIAGSRAHVAGPGAGRAPRRRRGRRPCSRALDPVEDELADGTLRVRRRRRGHPHRHRAAGHRAGRPGRGQAPHRPQPQRPGRHRPAALVPSGSCADVAGRGARPPGGAARPGRRGRATPTCPATPTSSGPSRCCWPTTSWPTAGPWPATSTGSLDARAPRSTCRPLGAGALAGSSLPLDPDGVAADLGFAAAFENSLDAVSRPRLRGRVAVRPRPARRAPVAASARRWCCGRPRSSASSRLDDAYATGSSMLPQKKNPDIAELARGKAGRLIGHLTGFLATLKGLPARLQPRPPGGQGAAVRRRRPGRRWRWPPSAGLLATATLRHRPAWRRPPTRPTAAATDLAEHLVGRGMPFRDAHAIVGALVRGALDGGVPLADLVAAAPAARARGGRAARAGRGGHAPDDAGRARARRRGRPARAASGPALDADRAARRS